MKRIKILILLITIVLSMNINAQTGINSPYSRYGLGQLYGENLNTINMSMGGLSLGIHNSSALNPANPASYGSLDSLAFLFEIGVAGNTTTLKTTTLSENGYDATLSYIFAGFPITRWWRAGVGIMPYSKIGYNVEVTVEVPDFSNVVHSFTGDGGLNQVFFGNGFNINEKLRLGIDVSYLFGQSSRSSMVYYPDSILIFGTKVESKVRGGDFIFDYGVQYDIDLNSTTQATIGITYANKFNLKAKRNYLSKTLSGGFNGEVEIVKDTIEYLSDEKGTIILPQRLGIGFAVVKEGIWLVGADFEWQNWTEFGAFNVSDTLSNSFRLTVGGEFTPVHSNISSLFKRMTYRAGLRYNQSYLNFDGTHINEFGISFGFGFPMKKSKTEIDLGFEFGRRGTTDNKLVQENFINFFLGVSIKEHWFQKRKYK
ncbi:MAG: hypothetical protein CL661_03610 [Bacteroidetes bacterium]|nr:hypothetical protein [Bacteroidota bacterium]|tara:strand:- start:1762 stop:3042 length:1281 start_codon:yes stop_codon:yes gene_type:complete